MAPRLSRGTLALPLLFIASFAAFRFAPHIDVTSSLLRAVDGAAIALAIWWGVLWMRPAAPRRAGADPIDPLTAALSLVAPVAVLVFWAVYWAPIADAWPLIAAQVAFAYACDALLSRTRGETRAPRATTAAAVLVINLFLRFQDSWFYWQLVMIAGSVAAAHLMRRPLAGRRPLHFTQPALALSVASLILLATGTTGRTWAGPLATELFLPPQIYLFIFAVSLPALFRLSAAATAVSAVVATYAFSAAYFARNGTYFFIDSHVPIGVFLAMTVLLADPETAPHGTIAGLATGVAYAAGVVAAHAMLQRLGLPTVFDKLLPLPIIEFARLLVKRSAYAAPSHRHRVVYTGAWIVVFGAMTAARGLGDDHPGHTARFWKDACREQRTGACEIYARILTRYCGQGSGWSCNEAGLLMSAGRLTDNSQAVAAFQSACALQFAPGCVNRFKVSAGAAQRADPVESDYPLLLSHGKGPLTGLPTPVLLERGCNDRWPEACGLLGLMKLRDKAAPDKPGGASFLKRGCDGGNAQACANLAFAYKMGDGVDPDRRAELELLQRACDLDLPEACRWKAEEASQIGK